MQNNKKYWLIKNIQVCEHDCWENNANNLLAG